MKNSIATCMLLSLAIFSATIAEAQTDSIGVNNSEVHLTVINEYMPSNDDTWFVLRGEMFWKSNNVFDRNNVTEMEREYGMSQYVLQLLLMQLVNQSTEYVNSNKAEILNKIKQEAPELAKSYGITILKINYLDLYPQTLYANKTRIILQVRGTSFIDDLKYSIHPTVEIYYIDTSSTSEENRIFNMVSIKIQAEQLLSKEFDNISSAEIYENHDERIKQLTAILQEKFSNEGIRIQEVKLTEISSSSIEKENHWDSASFFIGFVIALVIALTIGRKHKQ